MSSTTSSNEDEHEHHERGLPFVGPILGIPGPGEFDAREGEQVVASWRANHTQNRRRAVGGRLFLTTDRVAFRSHSVDANLGGRDVDVAHHDVAAVGAEPGGVRVLVRRPFDALFGGGLRTRLRIDRRDGESELFVVSDVDEVVVEVESVTSVADRNRQ